MDNIIKIDLIDDTSKINVDLTDYNDTEIRALIDTKQPKGNYLTKEDDPTVPKHVKEISQNDINLWNNKQDKLVSGTNIKTINNESILGSGNIVIKGGGGGGTSNYEDLENLPKVNNVELKGNKSLNDLGIQPSGNYITNTELEDIIEEKDLATKSDVKEQIDDKIWVGTETEYNNLSTINPDTLYCITE